MTLLLLPLPGNEGIADGLMSAVNGQPPATDSHPHDAQAERITATLRQFPDGETYVRIESPVRDRDIALVCTLHRPDDKLLPLLFLAATARDLGARSVGLIAPYLAYMRQDRRFADGEGVTSSYVASLLSRSVDWLVTVDPHLHRRASLAEIYSIPAGVVHAAPNVADWIRTKVQQPLLVGPDEESAQWVGAVAASAGAPSLVLQKIRRGDRDVSVTVPDVEQWRTHTPVLVDDIVATARTMIETVGHLLHARMAAPLCIGVHAVFAPGAYGQLLTAGATDVVTCNTIPHPSNRIDVLADVAREVLRLRSHGNQPPSGRAAPTSDGVVLAANSRDGGRVG